MFFGCFGCGGGGWGDEAEWDEEGRVDGWDGLSGCGMLCMSYLGRC